MPKRGGGRNNRRWQNDHFEHDDRGPKQGNIRRVSFKPGAFRRKNDINITDANLLLDDDIDMGGNAQGQRRNNRGSYRGRGGRINSPLPKKQFQPGPLPWYQICIPYGSNYEKDDILKSLLSYVSPEVFVPLYYKLNGNAAIFYVDDESIARSLHNASRKIMMPNGFSLAIFVKNTLPRIDVDEQMKEKMKLVMGKRYNPVTKALDLTKFHADPDLMEMFCALFRPGVMLAAIDIIAENIPDIEALNLNDNKLHGIDHLKILPIKLKHLKILYLGENRIPHTSALESLKGLPLVELFLVGNPFVTKYPEKDLYISDIRKKFPKLIKLDAMELPPAIGFDVDKAELPAARQSFLIDQAGQDLVREFLTQYFAIYDSESRQPLLEAYHENAMMSVTANYNSFDSRVSNNAKLNAYFSSSRNLMRVRERDHRRRLLRTSRLQVVSCLSDLPRTKHDLLGFNVDLTVFTPAMIMLTMNGVFKEVNVGGTPMRSFHRTFVIVPNTTGGFSIVNDMLFITNATKEQISKAFEVPAPTPVPVPIAAVPVAPAVTAGAPDDAHKMQALTLLGQQTGMNQHWSMNCLQEVGWDLQRALFIFNQLQSEGKIPQEAFIK